MNFFKKWKIFIFNNITIKQILLKSNEFSAICEKLKVGLREDNFSWQGLFFRILILMKSLKIILQYIEDKNEKICSRFSDTVCHKIDFTAYGLNIDHPPALALNFLLIFSIIPKIILRHFFGNFGL